jgi:hypothetical protein
VNKRYLTPDGQLVKSIVKVYLSEDEKYYSAEINNVEYYDMYKVKDILTLVSKEVKKESFLLKHPELNVTDNIVSYTLYDETNPWEDFSIDYEIKEGKLVYITCWEWNKITKLYEEIDIQIKIKDFDLIKVIELED